MHECFNVVGGSVGRGHAVLVRAVEPISGIDEDRRTSGPGLLTRALEISRAHDGASLTTGDLFVAARTMRPRIVVSTRIGVDYAGVWAKKPWRFYDPNSRCVSRG
jgi:DNA-3-methyladenine glycosylase